jgi:plastocyanin
MFFSTLSLGLAVLPFVASTVYDVTVSDSAGDLAFVPEAISAVAGDQVVFHFYPKNHTVTQSSFASPCGPLAGGINSGFMPVAANTTGNFPTFSVTVNDTTPTWIYCAQAANTANSHCGAGMVFAINCGADGAPNSFTNFKNAALQIGTNLKASAAAAAGASSTPAYGYGGGSATTTSPPAGYTIPPAETGTLVTVPITVESSTWTTTYTSYPNSPAATPNSLAGNVIDIAVGGIGELIFSPAHVSANPRDIVRFTFHETNHTVTQSSFASPCSKAVTAGIPGFDSGFMPFATGGSSNPVFNLTINDTTPIWGYCKQAANTANSHCGKGMVFSINSDESGARNYSAFQGLAEAINGTGASASGSASSSGASAAPSSGATTVHAGGALTLALGAVLAAFL